MEVLKYTNRECSKVTGVSRVLVHVEPALAHSSRLFAQADVNRALEAERSRIQSSSFTKVPCEPEHRLAPLEVSVQNGDLGYWVSPRDATTPDSNRKRKSANGFRHWAASKPEEYSP